MKKEVEVEWYKILVFDEPVSKNELIEKVWLLWWELIKAVVDIDKWIIAAGGELHADEEQVLLDLGSEQKDLWGINLYFDKDDWIEYDSMINIRPKDNNYSRFVESENNREKIKEIVYKLIKNNEN